MFRGILFDLVHTLTGPESEWSDLPWTSDVLGIDRKTWNAALTTSSRWRLAGQVRDPTRIVAALARQINPSILDETIERAVRVRIERFRNALTRIPSENLEVLRNLRRSGVRLALVSNADAMEISGWSSSPLMGLFDVEVFSCEVGLVKPEREIYECCLNRLGLAAKECVFVGDGGSGELTGARAVGLTTVFVSGVMSELWPEAVEQRAAEADFRIARIPDLMTLPIKLSGSHPQAR